MSHKWDRLRIVLAMAYADMSYFVVDPSSFLRSDVLEDLEEERGEGYAVLCLGRVSRMTFLLFLEKKGHYLDVLCLLHSLLYGIYCQGYDLLS